jgi:hypothetical protein
MLLAIALQESDLDSRDQDDPAHRVGPARGLWQFEQGGGVRGVLSHRVTAAMARRICASRACPPTERSIFLALGNDDLLACGFARLLLWADPSPLPALGDRRAAWGYYERNWRPGKPHPDLWSEKYDRAISAISEQGSVVA